MIAERVPLEEFVRAGQLLGLSATETLRVVRSHGFQIRTAAWWALWRALQAEREGEATA